MGNLEYICADLAKPRLFERILFSILTASRGSVDLADNLDGYLLLVELLRLSLLNACRVSLEVAHSVPEYLLSNARLSVRRGLFNLAEK